MTIWLKQYRDQLLLRRVLMFSSESAGRGMVLNPVLSSLPFSRIYNQA